MKIYYFAGLLLCAMCTLSACQNAGVKPAAASQSRHDLPQVVTQNGRHAFLVDGKPFLMLGAQTNNSANYPAALDKVWPVVDAMHANTLGIPVAWEQIEPEEGQFDFSYLDVLIRQAAER